MDPTDEIKRKLSEEICPICNQPFTDVEHHISEDHAGGLGVGFVKWVMRIHKDLEKIKKLEEGRGVKPT